MSATVWLGIATPVALLPVADVTASGNGAGVDMQKYRGPAVVVLDAAAPSAGTLPTLAIKLQTSPEAKKHGTVTYTGTGNGRMEVEAGPDPVAETVTITASSATEFAVVGSVPGALGTATVGTWFTSAQVNLLITAGGTAFVATDAFSFDTTARTWTDLLTFTGLTTAASLQKKTIDTDVRPRYLRAVKTLGGTDSPAYLVSMNLLAAED